jgi:Dolichyl-phosphate-mannose-protein mannosyltransferase
VRTLIAAGRDHLRPPGSQATYLLIALLLVGLALRLLATISWWPTATTLADSPIYAQFAESNPFDDPQHPAGYGLILASIGALTREVAAVVVIQHLTAFASALLLFAATRRITGSAWPGLLPAAIVLLNPDEILLEHAVMAESWALLATSAGMYAAVRAFEEPRPAWRWPLMAGLLLAVSVTIRTAGLAVILVVLLALLLASARGSRGWRRWAGPAAAAAGAATVLLGFAVANATFGQRLGIGPSPGWYLYARAAQFADCNEFTPPDGTEVLCEETPPAQRRGARYYVFDPSAPAPREFGTFPDQTDSTADELLGQWAGRAIRAQPRDYLESVWENLRAYWVPSLIPVEAGDGEGLDPLLDFRVGLDDGFYAAVEDNVARDMEQFYNDFTVDRERRPLELLSSWQQVSRFGGTMLSIATALVLLGLVVGTRRDRLGVLVLGIGGLALIVAPALTGNYTGRYTVPMAGPMLAGAAIALTALGREIRSRREGPKDMTEVRRS